MRDVFKSRDIALRGRTSTILVHSLTSLEKKLTQVEGTATVSYADVSVKSISLLMTVLKFDSVFFRPVNLSTSEDDINERSPTKQKLSQL